MFSRGKLYNTQTLRSHNFTTTVVGHEYIRRNAIENAVHMIEDLGIADEVDTISLYFVINSQTSYFVEHAMRAKAY